MSNFSPEFAYNIAEFKRSLREDCRLKLAIDYSYNYDANTFYVLCKDVYRGTIEAEAKKHHIRVTGFFTY